MKKIALIISMLASTSVFSEPTWYGNVNININQQDNYDPLIDELYMDSNYSYLGIVGQENIKGYDNVIKKIKYKVEFDLEINDQEKPIKLNQALVGFDTLLGNVLIGHQKTIQNDVLLEPMNVFNASRIIALEETEYVSDIINNTIRLDSKIMGMYIGASISMDNSDPESESIDSIAFGIVSKGSDYQYGLTYWEDKNWNNSEGVGYWGGNISYNYNITAISASLVKPSNSKLPKTEDIAFALKFTNNMDAKIKYGNVENNWISYGFGLESKFNDNSKWYLEYQKKDFEDNNLNNQSLLSLGLNYKL